MHAIDFKQARISQLEQEAAKHLALFRQSWQNFVKAALELKSALGLNTKDWDSYCREHWQLAGSTIRVYKSSLDVATVIAELAGITDINESQAREINKRLIAIVPNEDTKLKGFVWQLASDFEQGAIVPSVESLEAAYIVIKDDRLKNGVIEIEGEEMPLQDLKENRDMARHVLEDILTTKQRIHDHAKKKEYIKRVVDSAMIALIPELEAVAGQIVTISWKDSKDE